MQILPINLRLPVQLALLLFSSLRLLEQLIIQLISGPPVRLQKLPVRQPIVMLLLLLLAFVKFRQRGTLLMPFRQLIFRPQPATLLLFRLQLRQLI